MNTPINRTLCLLSVSGVLLLSACSSNSGYNNSTTRSAGAGAAVGAVLGGIIGHQSGDAAAGAALGAVAGGAAGGAYGNSKDKAANNRTRDSYGFTEDDYYNLTNKDEREILKTRAQGRTDVVLTSYLSDEERANLRRRASGQSQIGR